MSTQSTALAEARRLHARLHQIAFDFDVGGYVALELKQATIEAAVLESLLGDLVKQERAIAKQEALAL
jgi:hypothetical protein